MVLMFSFLAVFSVSDVNNTKAEHDNPFDINITLESGQRIEPTLVQKLQDLPDVKAETILIFFFYVCSGKECNKIQYFLEIRTFL